MLKHIALLLLGLTAAQKKGPCDETRECKRHTFSGSDKALCFGYLACKGATFETNQIANCVGNKACFRAVFDGTQPTVRCNGMSACNRARAPRGSTLPAGLNAVDKVVCNGLKACQQIVGGITAGRIMCDGDLTCSNFDKDKTLAGTPAIALNLNGPDLVYCNGNGCCREAQIRSDTSVYCDGDVGCKDSRIVSVETECQGKRSCMRATITSDTVDIFGWFGAAQSELLEPTQVNAFGFNALALATVATRGKDTVLDMRGFRAGADLFVDCGGGSNCLVKCKGNACKGMTVEVAKNSKVAVEPEECDPVHPDFKNSKKDPSLPAKVAGTHCPVINRLGRAAESSSFVQEELDFIEQVREELKAMDAEEEAKFEAYIAGQEEDYEDVVDEDDDDDDEDVVDGSYLSELFSFK